MDALLQPRAEELVPLVAVAPRHAHEAATLEAPQLLRCRARGTGHVLLHRGVDLAQHLLAHGVIGPMDALLLQAAVQPRQRPVDRLAAARHFDFFFGVF